MQIEKWENIVGQIKDRFEVEDSGSQHLEDEGGVDIEYIVFSSPLGKVRLEYVTKPVILDKKTTFSKRIGSETSVEYVYSKEEKSHQFSAYRWDEAEGDWAEIDIQKFFK